jgi:hypothetical protein
MAISTFGWFYIGAATVLFFFWAYGIVSFILDLKNTVLPGAIRYVRGRRRMKREEKEEEEREERKKQLY